MASERLPRTPWPLLLPGSPCFQREQDRERRELATLNLLDLCWPGTSRQRVREAWAALVSTVAMETASNTRDLTGEGKEGQGPGQGKSLVLYTATHPAGQVLGTEEHRVRREDDPCAAELTGQWEVGVVSCTVLNSPQGTPLSSQELTGTAHKPITNSGVRDWGGGLNPLPSKPPSS